MPSLKTGWVGLTWSMVTLPTETIMNYRIIEIDFDFDDALTDYDKEEIVDEVMSTTWTAVDGDDLVEEITCATGWCINSIDYCHVLSCYSDSIEQNPLANISELEKTAPDYGIGK